jgi:hypothetical protein
VDVHEALAEYAATLPRPVRFAGDVGRAAWEVEFGLYQAVSAVLTVLARESEVAVDFSRLRVLLTAPAGRLSPAVLRAALEPVRERLAALGGALTSAVTGGTAVVDVQLTERVESSALYRRVCELVADGQATATASARPHWDAVAARLTSLPRLAVVRPAGTARESALGVTVVDAKGPADETLAAEFLADGGPRGGVDAVLCLVPPTPAFRAALRWGRQRVVLSESSSLPDLARTLVAWGPVVAARRALVTIRELTVDLPSADPLRWAADQVGAGTHEIAELDLLDDLARGELLRGPAADAARLLGANGRDARTRLSLPPTAGDEEVQDAADQAVRRWRAHAERPGAGGRERAACEVLARTAEGMLT